MLRHLIVITSTWQILYSSHDLVSGVSDSFFYILQVHKLVLAACSPYFKAMFTSNFKECHASEVTLRDVCPAVISRLIDFAYTSRITVGEKCVLHVLLTAMRYQMEEVAKACCDFLTKSLEPSNVIGISRFAEEIGCTELHLRTREYINTHFNEVRDSVSGGR